MKKTPKIITETVITQRSGVFARFPVSARAAFFIAGAASTFWFLVRVIPKPSRATYPCMQATAPFMSAFVVYLLGITSSVFAFHKARFTFANARYIAAAGFFVVGLGAAIFTMSQDAQPVYANSKNILGPNQPVGEARGIFPGRVVWVWDSSATNELCTNAFGDGWFRPENTDVNIVGEMTADAVRSITGQAAVGAAWDALFRSFNGRHGRGDVGYSPGEKIFIRVNHVSASDNTIGPDYTVLNTSRYGMAETSPQVVLAILRQLVDSCGIAEENITVGDPMKHMYKHAYDMWHGEFPGVIYLDKKGTFGRTIPVADTVQSIFYSDRGAILRDGGTTGLPVYADYFPTAITRAHYVICIPALKGHARAGTTLTAKVHFGSNMRSSAAHLHGGLVAPNKTPTRTGYGLYRVQVDLMGHKDLGEKTVLFIVDGLWGGSEANDPPRKFSMSPFNGDWTSSIFVSQDAVALESVCFDFLKAEFTSANPFGSYPQIDGADDHIVQAADSTYWPAEIRYDPENDGSNLRSLGVAEHWNSDVEKKYTRNLQTGNGIELVLVDRTVTSVEQSHGEIPALYELTQNYPNPFNPSTDIRFSALKTGWVRLAIYDIEGKELSILVQGEIPAGRHEVSWQASDVPSGTYFVRMTADGFSATRKLVLLK